MSTTKPNLSEWLDKRSPERRYRTDQAFCALVDMLENLIHKAQYTPSDLREASLLAAIHYEYHNIQPRSVPYGPKLKPTGSG